jgi:Leucine-rich repeat (LRR) protein
MPSRNQLTSLPEAIAKLPLEILNVSSNKLRSLPASIVDMIFLRELVRRLIPLGDFRASVLTVVAPSGAGRQQQCSGGASRLRGTAGSAA